MTHLPSILLPAQKDGKSGYINSNGQVIIDFEFDFLASGKFLEGLASALVKDKAGFINTKGDFVIHPQIMTVLI